MKLISYWMVASTFLFSSLSYAANLSWPEFLDGGVGYLDHTLTYPTGFTVDQGTKFTVIESYPLDGIGVTFMQLQAETCSDLLHIEEMMIIEPQVAVGVTWDPGCRMEVFIETFELDSKSIFTSVK